MTWLFRQAGDDLVAAIKAASVTDFAFRWFAAHRDEARAMRAFRADEQKLDHKTFTSVAYWQWWRGGTGMNLVTRPRATPADAALMLPATWPE